jgi:hypothetical protein
LCAEVEGAIVKGPSNVAIDNRTINVLRVPTRDVTPKTTPTLTKFKAQQTS